LEAAIADHEAEVRAVIERHKARDQKGLSVSVDLEQFLLAVVRRRLARLVRCIGRIDHGAVELKRTSRNSELLSTPFF